VIFNGSFYASEAADFTLRQSKIDSLFSSVVQAFRWSSETCS